MSLFARKPTPPHLHIEPFDTGVRATAAVSPLSITKPATITTAAAAAAHARPQPRSLQLPRPQTAKRTSTSPCPSRPLRTSWAPSSAGRRRHPPRTSPRTKAQRTKPSRRCRRRTRPSPPPSTPMILRCPPSHRTLHTQTPLRQTRLNTARTTYRHRRLLPPRRRRFRSKRWRTS